MVKYQTGRESSLTPFKRTKPGIGAEHLSTFGRKLSNNKRLTQFGPSAGSSNTLVHFTDPTLVNTKQ